MVAYRARKDSLASTIRTGVGKVMKSSVPGSYNAAGTVTKLSDSTAQVVDLVACMAVYVASDPSKPIKRNCKRSIKLAHVRTATRILFGKVQADLADDVGLKACVEYAKWTSLSMKGKKKQEPKPDDDKVLSTDAPSCE